MLNRLFVFYGLYYTIYMYMYYCTVLSLYEDTTLQERDKALQEVEQSKNKQDTMETAVEKLKKDLEISKREKEKLSSSLSDLESYRENMLAKVREYYCSYYSYRQGIYGFGLVWGKIALRGAISQVFPPPV